MHCGSSVAYCALMASKCEAQHALRCPTDLVPWLAQTKRASSSAVRWESTCITASLSSERSMIDSGLRATVGRRRRQQPATATLEKIAGVKARLSNILGSWRNAGS
eukprot:scaffold3800_cov56-Phaeocystis_antarctica.AAC.1